MEKNVAIVGALTTAFAAGFYAGAATYRKSLIKKMEARTDVVSSVLMDAFALALSKDATEEEVTKVLLEGVEFMKLTEK